MTCRKPAQKSGGGVTLLNKADLSDTEPILDEFGILVYRNTFDTAPSAGANGFEYAPGDEGIYASSTYGFNDRYCQFFNAYGAPTSYSIIQDGDESVLRASRGSAAMIGFGFQFSLNQNYGASGIAAKTGARTGGKYVIVLDWKNNFTNQIGKCGYYYTYNDAGTLEPEEIYTTGSSYQKAPIASLSSTNGLYYVTIQFNQKEADYIDINSFSIYFQPTVTYADWKGKEIPWLSESCTGGTYMVRSDKAGYGIQKSSGEYYEQIGWSTTLGASEPMTEVEIDTSKPTVLYPVFRKFGTGEMEKAYGFLVYRNDISQYGKGSAVDFRDMSDDGNVTFDGPFENLNAMLTFGSGAASKTNDSSGHYITIGSGSSQFDTTTLSFYNDDFNEPAAVEGFGEYRIVSDLWGNEDVRAFDATLSDGASGKGWVASHNNLVSAVTFVDNTESDETFSSMTLSQDRDVWYLYGLKIYYRPAVLYCDNDGSEFRSLRDVADPYAAYSVKTDYPAAYIGEDGEIFEQVGWTTEKGGDAMEEVVVDMPYDIYLYPAYESTGEYVPTFSSMSFVSGEEGDVRYLATFPKEMYEYAEQLGMLFAKTEDFADAKDFIVPNGYSLTAETCNITRTDGKKIAASLTVDKENGLEMLYSSKEEYETSAQLTYAAVLQNVPADKVGTPISLRTFIRLDGCYYYGGVILTQANAIAD